MDPLWLAMSKLRRGRLEECIAICDELMSTNPGDQVINYLKITKLFFDYISYN